MRHSDRFYGDVAVISAQDLIFGKDCWKVASAVSRLDAAVEHPPIDRFDQD